MQSNCFLGRCAYQATAFPSVAALQRHQALRHRIPEPPAALPENEADKENNPLPDAPVVAATRKNRNKKSNTSFELPIHRVLKQEHPDLRITKDGMAVMNSLIGDLLNKIATQADKLSKKKNANNPSDSAILPRDIEYALRLIMPGELADEAIHMGDQANERFLKNKKK